MEKGFKFFLYLSNQECLSGSFNGPALVETLRSISAEEAISTDTYEGYSAWSVAVHVLYYKHLIGRQFEAKLPEYRFEEANFLKTPAKLSAEEWEELIVDIEQAHKAVIDAVAAAPIDKLEETFDSWKMPLGKAFAWLVSHDTNHNAQIRNMGLESLRKPID